MSDGSSAAPDPLRAWLEATGTEHQTAGGHEARTGRGTGRGPRRLLVAAGVMVGMTAVLGVAVAGRAPAPSAPTLAPAAPAAALAASEAAPPPAVVPSPTTAPAAPAGPAHPPASPSDAGAAAAVLAVRAAAEETTYVDTAVVDGVDVRKELTVVTVAAWVLQHDGSEWGAGRAVRYGVALGGSPARPVVLASPWVLPAPSGQKPRLTWQPVDDAPLRSAAVQTLDRAGYRSVEHVELARTQSLPGALRVVAAAVAPGDAGAGEQEVWLSADGSRILGDRTGTDLPIPGDLP